MNWDPFETLNPAQYRPAECRAYAETDNPLQRLYISRPHAEGPFPIVVWFHGGGLTEDGREPPTGLFNGSLVIMEARYRLTPDATPDEILSDAAAAVAFARREAAAFGGDAGTIFVGGYSAGAWLAAMVGMAPQFKEKDAPPLAGLLLGSGQMTTHFQVKRMLGYPGEDVQPVIDRYAPLAYASADLPPIFLATGESGLDMPARPEENAFMTATLRALGHPWVESHCLAGESHATALAASQALLAQFVQAVLAHRNV